MTVSSAPRCFTALVLLCASAIFSARAEVVTLFPSADASLISVVPTNSIGAFGWLTAGTTQNGDSNRALIKFDIAAAIPPGSTILDATLSVWVLKRPADDIADSLFSLRRVLRAWNEGTNFDPGTSPYPLITSPGASPGDATWTHSQWALSAWAQPGGAEGTDYSPTFSAGAFIGGVTLAPYIFEGTGLGADVQLWLDNPGTNFGWMLKTEEEETHFTARRFGSRELEDTSASPQLTITYLPPVVITNVQVANNRFSLSFHGELGYSYTVQSRSTASGTNSWSNLTNFGALLPSGLRTATDSLTNAQRFYRVRRN